MAKRKPGRPKLPKGEGKKTPLNMRTTQQLRARLERAAAESGRSLVHEVEHRLERTFITEDFLGALGADEKAGALLRDFLDAKTLIEGHREASIWTDFEANEAFKSAVRDLVAGTTPNPSEDYNARTASYEKYKEDELRPWREKAGLFGLVSNPEAGSPPKLESSPLEECRLLGRAAAKIVKQNRLQALAAALMAVAQTRESRED